MGCLQNLREKFKHRAISFRVALMICMFGAGSWIEVNGIWVELPILVNNSPQGWNLPSYLVVAVALANIGPIMYALCYRYVRYKGRPIVKEVPVIYASILTGVVSTFLLAFLWQRTNEIAGKSYSTALIGLCFCLSLVDCTSSVSFMPYMTRMKKEYMSIYFVGEGLSGLIPSLIALAQGVGKQNYNCELTKTLQNKTITKLNGTNVVTLTSNILINVTEMAPKYFQTSPRFSAQVFFLLLFALMVICLISFICLNHSSIAKAERATSDTNNGNGEEHKDGEGNELLNKNSDNSENMLDEDAKVSRQALSMRSILILLVAMGFINALSNGILPSVSSYACLPYGRNIYHLTLTLSAIANPIFCFLYYYVPSKSVLNTIALTMIYTVTSAYVVGVAASSPCPILQDSSSGGIIMVSYYEKIVIQLNLLINQFAKLFI